MRTALRFPLPLALTLSACSGLVGGAGGAGDGPEGIIDGKQVPLACELGIPQSGEERIYRLTPEEYTNTVRVLLGDGTLDPSVDADKEPVATLLGVRKWFDAAEQIVPGDTAWMDAYAECDLGADAACASSFVEAFATAAFRRPLTDEEGSWLAESLASMPADATAAERLSTMAELVLQAPQFLYLYAEGTPIADSPHGLRSLSGFERAQRLSYFLWDLPPDAELLRAAETGELDARDGVRAQAERMLADDRARPVLRGFLADWLELDGAVILPGLGETPKDGELYPAFNPALRAAMRTEIEAFMEYVMFEKDGSLEALFTDTRAYVNGPLAALYGVEGGPADADTWAWVNLDAGERAGMLTRAGFLAVHASQTVASPIRRGVYMLREILCYDLPPPPPDVDNTPVEDTDLSGDGLVSVREATVARTANATCAGCHTAINELGFAFGHYDAIGGWLDEEAGTGAAIDATATLRYAGEEVDGPVNGAVELSGKLAMSPSVAACATEKWFEIALRRMPADLDACALEEIEQRVADSGSIRELLLALVESDAFLSVNHGVVAEGEGN